MAYTFLLKPEINNVLLLVGDTLSKMISLNDKSTGLLLGDGGIASLITKGEQYGESYFSMNTDGAYIDSVIIPAGGSRMMSSCETLQENNYEDGSKRNLEQVLMNGMDVFSFAISELPKDVRKLLAFANMHIDDIDKYAFHQANRFMTEHIAKKLKANPEKILRSIQKFGNTAGVSIPLTMVDNRELIQRNDILLMNAIGAGFAYGTVLLNIADCQILGLNEL
jgi:3-oxoacyl-[acyl-carrier-protein] synthase-3